MKMSDSLVTRFQLTLEVHYISFRLVRQGYKMVLISTLLITLEGTAILNSTYVHIM